MDMNIFLTLITSTNTHLTPPMTPVICSEQHVLVQAQSNALWNTTILAQEQSSFFAKSDPSKEYFLLTPNQLTHPHVDTASWYNLNATAKSLAASTEHLWHSWWLVNKNVLHMVQQQIQGPWARTADAVWKAAKLKSRKIKVASFLLRTKLKMSVSVKLH